ncbi:hypothetical protein PIB30_043967 [Stylosanthes scabra]|uniref:Protein FAR1-RELATED SEQUENCE n=1 Tax=Stylosanthes scabra TaxID=79078 RepID=A0ABU6RGA7_9FABA|nr:hypothetical protein [Stylosanthes scabra]
MEGSSSGDIQEYSTSEYSSLHQVFKVLFDKYKDQFACDCRLFETHGISCSHIFGALRYCNAKCISGSLILKRWTKYVNRDFISTIGVEDSSSDAVEKRKDAQSKLPTTLKLVGDPVVVKTKGAPRKVPNRQKRRRCLHCRSTKQNIRMCSNLSNKKDFVDREEGSYQPEFEDDLTVEESETNDLVGTQESAPAKTTPMESIINDKGNSVVFLGENIHTCYNVLDEVEWRHICSAVGNDNHGNQCL